MMEIKVLCEEAVKIDVDDKLTSGRALKEAILCIAAMVKFFAVQSDDLSKVFVAAAKNFLNDDEAIRACMSDMSASQKECPDKRGLQ